MMTQTTESPKLRFRADDGSEFPKWKSMPMRSLFSEVIEKNHPEYPVLSIRQGCGTILRDSSDRNIEYDKSNLTNYKVIEKGDFIIHLRSFEGGLECSALQGISSPAYRILRSDCIIPEAYKDYFRSHEFINHRLSEAVVGIRDGKNIDMNIFWEIKVPYIALPEQQKIADFLSAYDKKIFLQKERVETLKEQKKGLLQKMFPKEGESVPELRFPGFTGDWEQRKLSDLCSLFTDGDWIESKDQSTEGVRLVQTGNVGVTQYLDKTNHAKWISEDTFNRLKCEEIFEGDILISRLPDPAGRACIMPNLGTKMITAVDCTIVRTLPDVSSEYLVQYLSTERYFKEINNCLAGGTRQRVSRGNLAEFEIPLPNSADEQKAIGNYFKSLDHLITLHQRKLETMQEIKKGLLQQMFV